MKTLSASLALVLAVLAPVAGAETLLVERVQAENSMALPTRGSSMSQVRIAPGSRKKRAARAPLSVQATMSRRGVSGVTSSTPRARSPSAVRASNVQVLSAP